MTKGWLLQDFALPDAQPLIWQLRAADFTPKLVYAQEFAEDIAEEPLVARFLMQEENAQSKPLPHRLSSAQETNGAQEMRMVFEAEKGRYTVYFDVLETIASDLCLASLNGREIAAMAIPYAGNIDENGRYLPIQSPFLPEDFVQAQVIKEKYEITERYQAQTQKLRVFRFEIPFVCVTSGRQELSFRNAKARLNDTMNTFVGDGFRPLCVSLVQGMAQAPAVPSVFQDHPGRSLVDLWGWMSMTSFEHPANEVTKPSRQALRGVIESFKWGANNLEFLPVNGDGVALDLTGEAHWKGEEHYRLSKDTTWTSEEVEKLLHLAHEHGMLCEFFLYCLHGAGFLATDMPYDEKINFLEKVMKRYGGCRTVGKVDGVIVEGWFPVDGPAYTDAIWKHNPASFVLSSNNDGSQYDMINAGYSPALHHYAAHWPGFDTQHTGYDHAYSVVGYPTEFYQKKEGTVYTYLQACGQTKHPRKNFPRVLEMPKFGITNRTVSPDWIIAQTHGFALRRLVEGTNDLPMALCWEADEETMAPEIARRYVYAASQDPICLAAAAQLSDLGEGGELSLKRATKHNHALDDVRIRARHRYPKDTYFAQNRFLQLLMVQEHEYAVVQVDLSETATFYSSGSVATLGNAYAVTRFEDARFLSQKTEILESVGPVCVVCQEGELGSGFVSFHQKTVHTVYSEVPAVVTEIARRIQPGRREEIDTYFDISRYDTLDGMPLEGEKTYDSDKTSFFFTDSTGVLPGMYLQLEPSNLATVHARVIAGNALYFNQTLTSAHSLKVVCALQMGQFAAMQPEEMMRAIEQTAVTVSLEGQDTIIPAACDGVKCVCVENPDEAPYFVEEQGWWHFKGPTPSQQYPGRDYLRVTSTAAHPAKIMRYGYLTGGVRPSYGCQNILSFRALKETAQGASFTARLAQPSPMLCAPAIACAQEIAAVYCNQKPWQYFDGKTILLPSCAGDYEIEVCYGASSAPSLVKTHACVTNCQWSAEEKTLSFVAEHPIWVNEAPRNDYTAFIDTKQWKLDSICGAAIVEQEEDGVTVSFRAGAVSLVFTKEERI